MSLRLPASPFLLLPVLVALSGCDAGTEPPDDSMPRIEALAADERPDIPGLSGARWYRAGFGWIVATDGAGLQSVGIEVQSAARAFAKHFARAPGPGAVVELEFASHAGLIAAAGAEWVMHWRRQGVEHGDAGRLPGPRGELRHEIGHLLFMTYVWPNTRGYQYGGDAPDWLDEAAAILMESEPLTRRRRARFGDMDSAGRIMPLSDYLTMVHPYFASPELLRLLREGLEDKNAQDLTAPGREIFSARLSPETHTLEIDFYAQTRGFIDFLLGVAGDDRVFLEIAQFLKAGGTMDGWLAESETARVAGLGGSVEALERRWLEWIEARWRGHAAGRLHLP